MNQEKIGRFIAERRKAENLTQMQLAEKLNITDRAVSKWETGKSMPDSSIMPELCQILNISINDLFNGEVIVMENYKEKTERLLLEMSKQKEESDKKLLRMEIFIGYLSSITFMVLIFVASFIEMPLWVRICLIALGLVLFISSVIQCLKIEQTAGYYECAECGHRYVPTFKNVFFAPHINRTRRMKCPNCGKKSWNRKVTKNK